jgi:hypothetical protein
MDGGGGGEIDRIPNSLNICAREIVSISQEITNKMFRMFFLSQQNLTQALHPMKILM